MCFLPRFQRQDRADDYKLMQDLGFKIDLVNKRIDPRTDEDIWPPFLL